MFKPPTWGMVQSIGSRPSSTPLSSMDSNVVMKSSMQGRPSSGTSNLCATGCCQKKKVTVQTSILKKKQLFSQSFLMLNQMDRLGLQLQASDGQLHCLIFHARVESLNLNTHYIQPRYTLHTCTPCTLDSEMITA